MSLAEQPNINLYLDSLCHFNKFFLNTTLLLLFILFKVLCCIIGLLIFVNLIKKYEKLADYYNVSKVCRGLIKPKTSEKGFLVVFKEIKGNYKKLKNLNVYNNNKKLNINWNDKRDNQVKAKYNLMKKMKLFTTIKFKFINEIIF